MGFFKRLFGICNTPLPGDAGCWSYSNNKITIDLKRAPELTLKGSALRLEGRSLPQRFLVVHGNDGEFHAFVNKCAHAGRRIDLVADEEKLMCCSLGKSTYDYSGKN